MAVKNTTQVLIDGKIITLGGYESPEYLQKVAAYLNQKISELSQSAGYNRLSVSGSPQACSMMTPSSEQYSSLVS